jgi:hypothetical protein
MLVITFHITAAADLKQTWGYYDSRLTGYQFGTIMGSKHITYHRIDGPAYRVSIKESNIFRDFKRRYVHGR